MMRPRPRFGASASLEAPRDRFYYASTPAGLIGGALDPLMTAIYLAGLTVAASQVSHDLGTGLVATTPTGAIFARGVDPSAVIAALLVQGIDMTGVTIAPAPDDDVVVFVTSRSLIPPSADGVTAYLAGLSTDARAAMQGLINALLGRVGG